MCIGYMQPASFFIARYSHIFVCVSWLSGVILIYGSAVTVYADTHVERISRMEVERERKRRFFAR